MARPRSFDEDDAVERAMLLFWRHGYAGTSVRDLGEELDLRPGSLYAAFGDKQALFHRALDRYCEGQGAGLLASVDGDEPLLPRLRAMLLGIAEANRLSYARAAEGHTSPPPGCLMVSTALDLPDDRAANDRVRATFDRIDVALEQALAKAVQRGEVRADINPQEAARFLTTVLQGIQVVSTADPSHGRVPATVDLVLGTLTPA